MSHVPGAYLGSVRDLATLRGRCVIDGDCWIIRRADGKPLPEGKVRCVWVYGLGSIPAARAAWLFKHGQLPPLGHVVTQVQRCGAAGCVNPAHLTCRSRSHDVKIKASEGRMKSARKTIANRIEGQRRSQVSAELRAWLIESPQSVVDAAHGLGIQRRWAAELRSTHRARHVVAPGASA